MWVCESCTYRNQVSSYYHFIPSPIPGFEQLVWCGSRRYHMQCNWKVFIDNFLDGGMHVSIAHPNLASGLDMRSYTREVLRPTTSASDVMGGSGIAPKDTNTDIDFSKSHVFLQTCLPGPDRSETLSEGNADIVSGRRAEGDVLSQYLYHYPNLCINRYGKWMDTNVVWPHPTNGQECFVDFDWYAADLT